MKQLMGIDIGGTKSAVVLGILQNEDTNGITVVDKVSFPTEVGKGLDYSLSKIFDNVDGVLLNNKWNPDDLSDIGISCGGPLDSKNGIILSPPNLIGWDNVPIVELFEKRMKVKTKLQNDANACALAEWMFGAGRGCSNVVFLTFGTGMGAGLILNGRLYVGTNDMAGEVGHVRLDSNGPVGYGKSGSFEGFCSGGGISQLAGTKVLEKFQMGEKVSFCQSIATIDRLDAKMLSDAAKSGDVLANEIFKMCGHYLGKGISIIIDVLNPEVIIIGSIFYRSAELLWPEAYEVIKKESLERSRKVCKVVASALGEQIGDYAALVVAVYEY